MNNVRCAGCVCEGDYFIDYIGYMRGDLLLYMLFCYNCYKDWWGKGYVSSV